MARARLQSEYCVPLYGHAHAVFGCSSLIIVFPIESLVVLCLLAVVQPHHLLVSKEVKQYKGNE